jgi:hypothetical protein
MHARKSDKSRTIDLWGLARVAACVSVFALAVLAWTVHRVHAFGERTLQNVGEHMMRYAGATHQTAPELLSVNGATFHLSTGSVQAPVEDVLDRFHAKCNARNGRLHEQWADVSRRRGVKLDGYSSLLDGVFRSAGQHSGIVACFETGEARLAPSILLGRVQRVLATGDLAQLGQLRYAYVTRNSADTTVFVALWGDGRLNFREMFPARADAPGGDPAGVPRPAWTQRVISMQPQAAAASFHVYRSKTLTQADLFAFYSAQLPAAGFELLMRKPALMVARSRDRTLTLSMRDDPATKQGIATLAVQSD